MTVYVITGETGEFRLMVNRYLDAYPSTKLVLVGFSMGGNIVSKYLGEHKPRPDNILGAVSICQGYHAQQWVIMYELSLECKKVDIFFYTGSYFSVSMFEYA